MKSCLAIPLVLMTSGCSSFVPLERTTGYQHDKVFYEKAARDYCRLIIKSYRDSDFQVLSVMARDYAGTKLSRKIVRLDLQRRDPMGALSTKDYRWTDIHVEMAPSGRLCSLKYVPLTGMDAIFADIRDYFAKPQLDTHPRYHPPGRCLPIVSSNDLFGADPATTVPRSKTTRPDSTR